MPQSIVEGEPLPIDAVFGARDETQFWRAALATNKGLMRKKIDLLRNAATASDRQSLRNHGRLSRFAIAGGTRSAKIPLPDKRHAPSPRREEIPPGWRSPGSANRSGIRRAFLQRAGMAAGALAAALAGA